MTELRRVMLEELQRRNYSAETIRQYLLAVRQFAEHFGKRPDQLGPDELRTYQAYLLRERKMAVGTVVAGSRRYVFSTCGCSSGTISEKTYPIPRIAAGSPPW
jgi:hypothetical protein